MHLKKLKFTVKRFYERMQAEADSGKDAAWIRQKEVRLHVQPFGAKISILSVKHTVKEP